ncbi:MAG: helix-turn-helix transcriptional regulator [candidate division Zixibacteria bacterium]|nr:helix-turn-helix transcriptional regulator [candidate division Zixibacteria bacterium]
MAKLAGLRTPSHLSHWEKGRKVPNLENALRLSAIIQCPVEILFYDLFNAIRHDVFTKRQSSLTKRNDT